MKVCQLCDQLGCSNQSAEWNKPLFESPNFVVLPSLGALVEGWLLLVPKKHYICFGAMPSSLDFEMSKLKDFVRSVLEQHYGQIWAFEHGPHKPNCDVGCSVDHAHLHLVPLKFDLVSAMDSFLPQAASWIEANPNECRASYGRGEDYLYLEHPTGKTQMISHSGIGSQLFRRAIAAQIGIPQQFNWRH